MKRFFILIVSALVFAADRISEIAQRIVGKAPSGRGVVLYYHAVPEGTLREFERQMDILLCYAEPARAESVAILSPGKHYAVVTFDDGYRDTLRRVLPIMKSKGIPFTIFIAPEMMGSLTSLRDASAGSEEKDRLVVSDQELKQITSDFVTVGSHSLSHTVLPRLQPREAMYELSESRRVLEELLQRPVHSFCFPFGAFNEELLSLCRTAGYKRVFTTLPGWAFSDPEEFLTGRVRVDPTDSPWEFRFKVAGAYRWLPYAFALKRKILPRRMEVSASQNVAAN